MSIGNLFGVESRHNDRDRPVHAIVRPVKVVETVVLIAVCLRVPHTGVCVCSGSTTHKLQLALQTSGSSPHQLLSSLKYTDASATSTHFPSYLS
eukprot:26172_2